ncbi:MAG: c-type cytochrome [Candidatus Pedobacter colombiensis]|uniref:C-type cytochrome n=1 Tax=Candidatus Pedobacter colombiensis TaxID=3121371 RepID=A0AAJ5WCC0_9SPHI|nr:c-type cytochrome [Pedobacter sp.]WEK20864.1 MAG: c-type cytochrome [Pedobacter sp.]
MNRTLIFSSCLVVGLLSSGIAKSQATDPKKDVEDGKLLISKSDCFACHKPEGKLVGPSYADIAAKYTATEANVTLLSGKIIKGGSGNWGTIPMAAHPKITQVEAKKMVKYVLSLQPVKK